MENSDLKQQIIDRYRLSDETFKVTLPKGEELEFKTLTDYEDISRINRAGREFARSHLAGNIPPALKDVATKDEDIAFCCHVIAALSVNPKFDVGDVLQMKSCWGTMFERLVTQVVTRLQDISNAHEIQQMDELGKDSAQTS